MSRQRRFAATPPAMCGFASATCCDLGLAAFRPANAHTDHKKKPPVAAKVVPGAPQPADEAAATVGPGAMHSQMGEMMEVHGGRPFQDGHIRRLLDWLGRTHPLSSIFRSPFSQQLCSPQSLVASGPPLPTLFNFLFSPVGFSHLSQPCLAGSARASPSAPTMLCLFHRWLGMAVGVGGPALAIWAARRPEDDRGPGMIIALGRHDRRNHCPRMVRRGPWSTGSDT